jgi:hypothetical protein
MEVGHQAVDRAEAVAGGYEDGGVAFERANNAALLGRALDQPEAGGADGDDPASRRARLVQPGGGGGIDAAPFGVHPMVASVVGLHRQERPRADMQGERGMLNTRLRQRRHQRGGEMQRRSRGRHRSLVAREHRLIIVEITCVGGPLAGDIGRQRHPSRPFQQQLDRLLAFKFEQDRAIFDASPGDGSHVRAEVDPVAGPHSLGVAHKCAPAPRPLALVERGADARLAAPSLELRRDHARIVEHQHVARPQQCGQIAHATVAKAMFVNDEHPRRIARFGGPERDPIGRQVEIEKIDAHVVPGEMAESSGYSGFLG